MPDVLVVGASRGIGLGLVDVHLSDGWTVHATTRDGVPPRDHPAVISHTFDVRDTDQLGDLIDQVGHLDRIIHNAGVMRASRAETFQVNTVAPIRTVDGLLAAHRLRPGGTIALMTSQLGARRGRSSGLGDYGDSKAALNDEFRKRAPEWATLGAVSVVIHPGWVQTDMGGNGAPLTVSESASGIKRVMDALVSEDNGKFLTWEGHIHPW
ncbi:MAG TPA: SDR family NAD(P)-dependent oxidoreductase [Acidimicrobiia bacterium]|nr:SDR family NAD(P)-dependent oxidoreductase [Acidimicrobiia bacterium]